MKHHPAGSRPSQTPSSDWFTGQVRLDPVVVAEAPARTAAALVTFEPGARTNWHTHPFGQTIHVISGVGRARTEGGPVVTIRPGDTVVFAPGERHWHGAAPDCAMCHLAIHENDETGSAVTWAEPVSDADYSG